MSKLVISHTVLAAAILAVQFSLYAKSTAREESGVAPPGIVLIPGGEFTMGSNDQLSFPRERPTHRVKVDGFWIDATPVKWIVDVAHWKRIAYT